MAAWTPVPARRPPEYPGLYPVQRPLVCRLPTPACRTTTTHRGNLSPLTPGNNQPALLAGHGYTQYLVDTRSAEAFGPEALSNVYSGCLVDRPVCSWYKPDRKSTRLNSSH